jgi:hypothetical protein
MVEEDIGHHNHTEDIMNEKQVHFDWTFGLQWLAACGLGIMLLGMLAFASIWSVGEIVENAFGETAMSVVVGGLFGALFGLGASGGTGLLLRSKGVNAARWISYSVIGSTLGGITGFGVALNLLDAETMPDVMIALVMGISLGLLMGIGQWLALRQVGNGATAWPLISTRPPSRKRRAGMAVVGRHRPAGRGDQWIGNDVAAAQAAGVGLMLPTNFPGN